MITEEQEYFMQMAIDLSQYALDNNNNGPFGAIIVKNGNIIGSSGKSVYTDLDVCEHAEVMAIRDACKNLKSLDLTGCQIYSSSEPCPMCLAAIYWAQISSIYYCNSDKEILQYGYMENSIFQDLQEPKERRRIKTEHLPDRIAPNLSDRDLKIKSQQNLTIIQE